LEKKRTKCIFIGYPDEHKAYKLYDPQEKKYFINRDVIFDENVIYKVEVANDKGK